MQLIFLGTGAACGVPSFYCGCPACQEAQANPRYARTRSSLLIQGAETILIDSSPDLWTQLNRERVSGIDRLFITHWHYDHYAGLGELEFMVRLVRRSPLRAFMTAETGAELQGAFGYMSDCLDVCPLVPGMTIPVGDLSVTALAARHRPGTLGFMFERAGGRRIAYLPDTGPLPPETATRVKGIETLVLDATFWGRNWMPAEHHSVEQALRTADELQVDKLILTHLSMHYDQPITSQELATRLARQGDRVGLAFDGDRLNL